MALAIKQEAPSLNTVGYDSDSTLTKRAAEKEIVNDAELDLDKAIAEADILIIDLPQTETENLFNVLGGLMREHVVFTHLTPKAKHYQKLADSVVKKGFFVGSAPVQSAQTFESRVVDDPVAAARADYFKNSLFCLMPSPNVDEGAVKTVRGIGQLMGADPYFIDSAEYDVYQLALKTLPQVTSLALFESLHRQTAWKDLLRMAGNDFYAGTSQFADKGQSLAKDVFEDTQTAIHWINQMIGSLEEIRRWIEVTDEETLASLFSERGFERDIWIQTRKENQWEEVQQADVDQQSFRDMFMGSMFGRRRNG